MKYLKRITLENRDEDLTPEEQKDLDNSENEITDRYNRLRSMVSRRYGGGPLAFRKETNLNVREKKQKASNFDRFARTSKREDAGVIPLTLPMISEKKLFHVNQQDGQEAVDDLVRTTGKAAPKTPQSARRRAVALDTAEKPKSRKPPKPGDTPAQTQIRQDMFDLARHRREVGQTQQRGVPTKLSRRLAANKERAAKGQTLLSIDTGKSHTGKSPREDAGVIPLTLPMIAESNRARRAETKKKKQAILKNLQAKGDTRTVDSSTPGKLKFKQKEFDLGEKEGGYYKFLQGEKQREKASKREFEKHRSLTPDPDDEQKRKAWAEVRGRA